MIPPNVVVEGTASRFAERKSQREDTEQRLKQGSPLHADTPERVNQRIQHIAVSEMARATAFRGERAVDPVLGSPLVLERIIGTNDLMSVTFLELAVRVSRTVARVQIKNAAGQLRGYGTGFLVGPRVLLTNNHVLGTKADAQSSKAEFGFQDSLDGNPSPSVNFALEPDALFVTDAALDYTLVAIRQTPSSDVAAFGYNRLIEQEGKVLVGECLNIIQHPNGEPKQLALRENTLIDVLPQFLHYHTDTAPGSSGSPVFNDQWEVVALHHSGVPKTDAQGRYLTKDGALWTPAMGEHRIDWIANEGARISQIVAHLKAVTGLNAAARALRDSILTPKSPIESLGPATPAPLPAPAPQPDGRQGVVGPDGTATWTIPVQISVRVGDGAAAPATVTTPAVDDTVDAAAADDFLQEKTVVPIIDTKYGSRKGYNEEFLGVTVPMPTISNESLVARMEDDEYVIPYQHFSVVMNKKRRLAFFTASNVDGRKKSKEPEAGRDYTRKGLGGLAKNDKEKWVTDPRLAEAHQLPDVFFNKDRQSFDKGHLVRREDVCWGKTYATVRRANGDTYHTTNCSPQVMGFNQSGEGGIWGRLENLILSQAKNETYSLFSGPIFSDDDEEFEGVDDRGAVTVQIPSRYWKVVIARSGAGIQAFAFILEQDLSDVAFREEFAVNAEFAEHMTAIEDLEDLLRVVKFPKVVKDADQFGTPIVEEITRRHLEALGVPGGV